MTLLNGVADNNIKVDVFSLIKLAVPIILILASESLMNFLDRYYLAHYSLKALEAGTLGYATVALFQVSFVRMATVTQAFVGQAFSAGNFRQIGVYIWQMVWLSFFIMLFMPFIAMFLKGYLFSDGPVQKVAQGYYTILTSGVFFFPLAIAFNAFYIARKQLKFVVCLAAVFFCVNAVLSYLFIFGISGLLLPMAASGAALAKVMTKGGYCLVMFCVIMTAENRRVFGMDRWQFRWEFFWNCLKIGGSKALTVIILVVTWIIVLRIAASQGEQYLTILSTSDSGAILCECLNLGIGQAILVIASHIIGAQQWALTSKLIRSSFYLAACFLACLSLPFIFFTDAFLGWFLPGFPDQFSPELVSALRFTCYAMWVFEGVGWLDRVSRAFLTAANDTVYIFYAYTVMTVVGLIIPFYCAIYVWGWSPAYQVPIITVGIFARNIPLIYRIYRKWIRVPQPVINLGQA